MKRRVVLAILVAASVGGVVPVHAKAHHAALSCKAVRESLAKGKSEADVAAEMKTTTTAVARCSANGSATKQAKKTSSAK